MLMIYWNESCEKSPAEIRSAAIALYDMGLRESDRDYMILTLGLTAKEADAICEIMRKMER